MVAQCRFVLTILLCALLGFQQETLDASAQETSTDPMVLVSHKEAPEYAKCRAVCHLVAENTIFPERLEHWQRWIELQLDSRNHQVTQSAIDMEALVAGLGDDYTYFRSSQATTCHQTDWNRQGVITARMLPNNIGYVRISTFWSENVSSELESALRMLSAAETYILDLRDNNGGDIYEAHRACSMFLDKGVFSTLKGRLKGRSFEEKLEIQPTRLLVTTDGIRIAERRVPNLTGKRPMAVLVNKNTRSAAEMVAGCLSDNGRALLVGTTTFGKGVVQSTWHFEDGSSIKIAVAKHYLPSGRNIHGVGLVPDLRVDNHGGNDIQLARSVACLQHNVPPDRYVMHTAYSP